MAEGDVKRFRDVDSRMLMEVKHAMEYAGLGMLCDHSNIFRDENDRTVVTFSPYHLSPRLYEIDLPGYDVEISDYSIYGYGTKTIVITRYW